ncbi:MAG: TetR/AcrR family transcriptional regulator [Archangiaceae bacterium]|nr:TetR/AcrR family transcriptional regulator [Archangiaceae bacterium]
MARRKRPGQPGGVRDTNRKARVEALLEAAQLLFLDRGIEGVSVDDITTKAKMAKGSFYRYFDSQAALVEELLEPVRVKMTDTLEQCSVALDTAATRDAQFEAYKKVGDAIGDIFLSWPGVTRLYLQENRAPAFGARKPLVELSRVISKYAIDITEKAQGHGILKPIPVAVSALSVVGAAERLVLALLLEEPIGNPLDVPQHLASLILDGLKKPD